MNLRDYFRVAKSIYDCPSCGSKFVGNGQGTLEVDGDFLVRTCKCGFNLECNMSNGTSKKEIKESIDQALKQM